MGRSVEMEAADALLDRRLMVSLPAPWLLRVCGLKTVPIWVGLPVCANLVRMSRLFCHMDIDLKTLEEGGFGNLLECVAEHGVTASRMIAYGLIRGSIAARLLNRPLAWYIRSHMTMRGLAELTRLILVLSSAESFVSIIASASGMNLLRPTASQPEEKGS